MDKLSRAKKAALRLYKRYPAELWRKLLIAFVIFALFLTSCISIGICIHRGNVIGDARNSLGHRMYTYLSYMAQTGASLEEGSSIPASTLSSLKGWYDIVVELNSYLTETFGSRYTLLSSDRIATLSSSITACENALSSDFELPSATETLRSDLNSLTMLLTERYTDSLELKKAPR